MKHIKACVALFTIFALCLLSGCSGVHTKTPSDSVDQTGSVSFSSDVEALLSSEVESFFSSEIEDSSETSFPESSSDVSTSSKAPLDSSSSQKESGSSLKSTPSKNSSAGSSSKSTSSGISSKPSGSTAQTTTGAFSLRGLWVSCYELTFQGLDYAGFQKKVDTIMQTAAAQGYNAVFCHVRAFGDAYYPSDYFPFSKYLTGTEGKDPGYDPLDYMIRAARKQNLQFHAWINPYRVSTSTTDPTKLSANNIAAKWLTDSSERAVVSGGGIYFNPASLDAQKLVLSGVEEILKKYDVDGVHFDDYFYPTTSESFDQKTYAAYRKEAGAKALGLADWRRANVNSLVSAVYRLCKNHGVVFGISPAAHISTDHSDRNYNSAYADVALWMSRAGYVDYIIPQLYFGYNYPLEAYRYDNLLKLWCSLPRHSGLKLYIGLGAYKLGVTGTTDSAEWCNTNGNLLAREVTDAKNAKTDGFVVFSYTATSSTAAQNQNEMKNMFAALR